MDTSENNFETAIVTALIPAAALCGISAALVNLIPAAVTGKIDALGSAEV